MTKTNDWTEKRQDWVAQVEALIQDVSRWCEGNGWLAMRSTKQVSEDQIGTYEVPCLTIQAPSGRFHIDPIGVNIIGAQGRVDILAYPSMNRLLLVRKENKWVLLTESRVPWPKEWGEDAFSNVIQSLAA